MIFWHKYIIIITSLITTGTHHDYGQYEQAGNEHGQGQVTEQGGVGLDAGSLQDGRFAMRGRGGLHVVQFVFHRRPAFLGRRQVVTLAGVRVAAAAVVVRTLTAARHALSVLPVEVQREHARRTAKRARSGARTARRVARLAQLRGRVVVL